MDWKNWASRIPQTSGTFIALLYVVLGLTDLIFSLAAFAIGIPEANPVLEWLGQHGLFIQGKIFFTGLVALIIGFFYSLWQIRPIAISAVAIMLLVDLYHFVSLNALLLPPD